MQINVKNLLIFLLSASVFALVFAYVSQFVFGHQPCILCLYQRQPFFGIIVLSTLTLLFFSSKKFREIAFFFCVFLLAINFAIASYHAGVEQKIFKGPDSCETSSNLNEVKNLEELKAAIAKTKAIRCDEPTFKFLNLSMASWNALYCLALIASTLFLWRTCNRSRTFNH